MQIGHGETVTVRVPTHADGSALFWEFATDNYDVAFGLFFEWVDHDNETEISVHISDSEDEDLEDDDDEDAVTGMCTHLVLKIKRAQNGDDLTFMKLNYCTGFVTVH